MATRGTIHSWSVMSRILKVNQVKIAMKGVADNICGGDGGN